MTVGLGTQASQLVLELLDPYPLDLHGLMRAPEVAVEGFPLLLPAGERVLGFFEALRRRLLAGAGGLELGRKQLEFGTDCGEFLLVAIDQERARAYELARSRYPQVMNLPYATQVRRLMGALTRRGYDAGLASAVVRDVVSSDPGDMPVV